MLGASTSVIVTPSSGTIAKLENEEPDAVSSSSSVSTKALAEKFL